MTCDGKERFTTFGFAEAVAKRRRREGVKRQPYRCGECGSFHVGSHLGDRPQERAGRRFSVREVEPA